MIETRKADIREVEILAPTAQATTDAYADVVTVDTLYRDTLAIALLNTDATNDLKWKILGSIDNVTYYEVVAEATVQQASAGIPYTTTLPVWRYYKVQVKSAVGATPAEATVTVIAK